jgi:hypothetical protein
MTKTSANAGRGSCVRPGCGKPVEDRWKTCGRSVRAKFFSTSRHGFPPDRTTTVHLRTPFRLRFSMRSLESTLRASPRVQQDKDQTLVNPVRITQTIHGRSYVIEVHPVEVDRWRAQIARPPGGMSSLMPFYGRTPEDAATNLAGWLDRAGRVQGSTVQGSKGPNS